MMSNIRILIDGKPGLIEVSDGRLAMILPIRIKRRSGRKQITVTGASAQKLQAACSAQTPIQQAIVRGHRWLRELEAGGAPSLNAIARRERVDDSYISRMINLTGLAPIVIEAILDGELPGEITLFDLAVNIPVLWSEQCELFMRKQIPAPDDERLRALGRVRKQ